MFNATVVDFVASNSQVFEKMYDLRIFIASIWHCIDLFCNSYNLCIILWPLHAFFIFCLGHFASVCFLHFLSRLPCGAFYVAFYAQKELELKGRTFDSDVQIMIKGKVYKEPISAVSLFRKKYLFLDSLNKIASVPRSFVCSH